MMDQQSGLSITTAIKNQVVENLLETLNAEGSIKLTLNVQQAAEALGINRIKMYELARSDSFPSLIIGNRIVIPIMSFVEWMEKTAWDKNV